MSLFLIWSVIKITSKILLWTSYWTFPLFSSFRNDSQLHRIPVLTSEKIPLIPYRYPNPSTIIIPHSNSRNAGRIQGLEFFHTLRFPYMQLYCKCFMFFWGATRHYLSFIYVYLQGSPLEDLTKQDSLIFHAESSMLNLNIVHQQEIIYFLLHIPFTSP